jgi:hypothetical protein
MQQHRRFAIAALTTFLLFGCALTQSPREQLEDAYTRSIAEAAVKTPNSVRTLTPIDATQREIIVAHLQPYPTIDASRYIWISSRSARPICSAPAPAVPPPRPHPARRTCRATRPPIQRASISYSNR